jgi:hypothetical protein
MIMNPTIPRAGTLKKLHSRNASTTATIKPDFETGDDFEDGKISPGPGTYRTEVSSFRVKQKRGLSLQLFGTNEKPIVFGSNVNRFTEKPIGTQLGPGQYKTNVKLKNNSALLRAG